MGDVGMFREESGKVSFTRVSSFLLVLAYIFWASYIVITKGKIPSMPWELVVLISAAYGINKGVFGLKLEARK